MPTEEMLHLMSRGSNAEKLVTADNILHVVQDNGYTAISFDWRLYPYYTTYLKKAIKAMGADVYTWNHTLRIDTIDSIKIIAEYLRDETIDVFLVNFPSPFDL
jgi:hypothetical protein